MTDTTSVLPTLELLQRMGILKQFVHRHAVSVEEFQNYLSMRQQRPTRTFGIVYLAFHGSVEGLRVGEEDIDLDRLAEWLGSLRGGVVHLGSCAVLKNREAEVRRFLKRTGARLISGYDRPVLWLDSIALETAYLGYLAQYERVGDALQYFRKRYARPIDELTWVAYP